MLNQTAITYLAALTYREDAKRRVCWIPVSGIYWDDEIPDFRNSGRFPKTVCSKSSGYLAFDMGFGEENLCLTMTNYFGTMQGPNCPAVRFSNDLSCRRMINLPRSRRRGQARKLSQPFLPKLIK